MELLNNMAEDFDLVSKLSPEERAHREFRLDCVCPDDGKYGPRAVALQPYLSDRAEWKACAWLQSILLETRMEFGQAEQRHVDEGRAALEKIDLVNISMLEEDKRIMHDQLAVLAELGRYVSAETLALLHPGTTSYDIVDTVRPYLFKRAWNEIIRPKICSGIEKLCGNAERSLDILQVGRTHLQDTSPVPFGTTLAGYAARLANRVERCDSYFSTLKGKISGIVGTGAGIEMVIGEGKSLEFERAVLAKLGLEPDYTATQITQKESLADVGHGLTTLMWVLADFTDDIRKMYSSAIQEVTSRDNAQRLGGSSSDATKNNPIQWENMTGKATIVESGMRLLYSLIRSDFQRDLCGSVVARYQPRQMMAETYEAFSRLDKALLQLSVNEDRMARNLEPYRSRPSEALVTILRGTGWVHPEHGPGHEFVKYVGKKIAGTNIGLLEEALKDERFARLYEEGLTGKQKSILQGNVEQYTGSARERTQYNLLLTRAIIAHTFIP